MRCQDDLSQETQAQREPLSDPTQSMVHRSHIVRRLLHVAHGDAWGDVLLEKQEIRQGRLGPLDLR